MALHLELEPVPREIQRPLEQIAKLFPLGPEDLSRLPQCRVTNTGNEAIVTATLTPLTFDSERWDTGAPTGQHSTSSQTSRLTARVAGLYTIKGNVQWANNATGRRTVLIQLNGAGVGSGTNLAAETADAVSVGVQTTQSISTDYRLAVGDYVELYVFQSSGGNLNVEASGNVSPEFSFSWLSP